MRKSDRYFAWLKEAGLVALSQRPVGRFHGAYTLQIQAARPDKRRRDIDNLIKPISDLLQAVGIVRDDTDCEMVSARWVTTGEGVFVRISPAGVE